MRLLLVEDTAELAQSVLRFLRAEGHAVDHAADAATAAEAMALADYACVILDLGLPDGSGLDLLRARRRAGDRTPVLIATARDQISDRIAGLDAGADDYVVKPFDLHELAARIRAHARRAQGVPQTRVQVAGLEVDRAAARLWRDGAEVRLTAREWALFDALLGARGRVLPKAALEEALYAFDDAIEGNAVEVYVSRLRQKLGASVIETRRGLGYVLP
ncbi:response regulator transcription factor [Phaeovulum sp. NW3]|uniref:response regulator n=1 Tax=Phaeovulum sp. NW3 TaxID=2934933 RepID=UPI002022437C|nr:response regulator transcription factor [Phaeovulum sp. NW3]MCL7466502.1 response regulator transcription factor [Phaeovulum sp. NW3]